VARKPVGELHQLLAQAVDRLLVHVCLGDELGEGDYSQGLLGSVCGWAGKKGGGHTQETRHVLCAVRVDGALVLAVGLVPQLVHVVVLRALEAVGDAVSWGDAGRGEDRTAGAYRYSRMRPRHLSKYSRRPAMVSSRMSRDALPSWRVGFSWAR
jgi:hypothetical protein